MKRVLVVLLAAAGLFIASCDDTPEKIVLDPCECYDILAIQGDEHPLYDTCNQAIHANQAFMVRYTKCQYSAITGRDTADIQLPQATEAVTPKIPGEGRYSIVAEESNVRFIGRNTFLNKRHKVSIQNMEGFIEVKDSTISAAELTLDMSSLLENTKNLDDGQKSKIIKHLKSEDFFDVEKFPTASFVMTENNGATFKLKLKGDLTLHGETRPVEFHGLVSGSGEDMLTISGSFVINRTDYGVNYKSASIFSELGDAAISDTVPVAYNLVAKIPTE